MNSLSKNIYYYFLFLFCLIPITILAGSALSIINIILIDVSFIVLIIQKKKFDFLKDKSILYLFLLYAYLIFNSFISVDFYEGLYRNFGFIRIIILFAAINFFFSNDDFYKKVLKFWSLVILIVLVDVFIESLFGQNILGFDGKQYGKRIVSFFKDEPIVGGYLNGFYLLIIGFLMIELKKKYFLLILLILFIFVLAILLTGERSNTIKAFLGLSLFIFFIKTINLKKKIVLISATIILVFLLISNYHYLQIRFNKQIQTYFVKDSVYLLNYKSGFEVFKNNKILGVGNKNYRIEACKPNMHVYHCNTHPHQIYLELLSEHGILGTLVIFFVLYKLIFSKILKTIKQNNYIKLGTLIYMVAVFIPILPSGAFFNSYLLTLFFINLSIFYALDKKLNIFRNKH
jgi:O-antigen ligase